MRQEKPDMVLSYTIKPNIWAALAADWNKIPSIAMITGLGYTFTNTNKVLKQRIVKHIAKKLYQVATKKNQLVIFQNPDDLHDFINSGCLIDKSKAKLVNGSGVDTLHYRSTPLPDKPVFLMISRLLKAKGVQEYAEAAIKIKQENPEIRFLLVGYTENSPDDIQADQLAYWTDNGLEFLGPASDVRPAISSCTVYVLPSYREGTPRSVLEAMSMGRAIITTDAPGCRETTENNVNGFTVPVGDSNAVATAMRKFISQPSLASTMGAASLERVKTKYDVRAVNKTLMGHIGA